LTLTGEGSATTTIRAGGPFRVIQVSPMIMTKLNVTIGDVTVRDGVAAGTGTEAWGGGVFAINAHLTLRGVLLTDNRAVANGAVAVAGKAALGGGVADVSGVFTMLDNTVSGNAVEAIGGAGEKGGTAQGGGAAALGVYKIERSTIAGNVADARGGQGPANASQNGGFATGAGFHGISEWPEPSSIGTSTISGNVADASAGAGGSAGEVAGAGLFAVAPEGPVTAISTTIAENIARNLGNPGKGAFGGGAFAVTPAVSGFTFTSMTIAANGVESSTPASYGGNAFVAGPAGGIVFGNSLIANGVGPAGTENCYTGLEGVTSQGFNLDSHTSAASKRPATCRTRIRCSSRCRTTAGRRGRCCRPPAARRWTRAAASAWPRTSAA